MPKELRPSQKNPSVRRWQNTGSTPASEALRRQAELRGKADAVAAAEMGWGQGFSGFDKENAEVAALVFEMLNGDAPEGSEGVEFDLPVADGGDFLGGFAVRLPDGREFWFQAERSA